MNCLSTAPLFGSFGRRVAHRNRSPDQWLVVLYVDPKTKTSLRKIRSEYLESLDIDLEGDEDDDQDDDDDEGSLRRRRVCRSGTDMHSTTGDQETFTCRFGGGLVLRSRVVRAQTRLRRNAPEGNRLRQFGRGEGLRTVRALFARTRVEVTGAGLCLLDAHYHLAAGLGKRVHGRRFDGNEDLALRAVLRA